jgi:apolipoprotein N-acyltransferase
MPKMNLMNSQTLAALSRDSGLWLRLAAVAASALILWSVFPPAPLGSDGAWFALVPLLLVVRNTAPRRAFWLGWLCGIIFWLLSLTWLWRLIANSGPWPLVVAGHAVLAIYCGLYIALFALAASRVWRVVHRHENLATRLLAVAILEPLLWVGAEYLRCVLLTGFPWNPLGAAFYGTPRVIQVAALGGVYAVSMLVVLTNSAAASMVERMVATMRNRTFGEHLVGGRLRGLETFIPLLVLLALVLFWGPGRIRQWNAQAAAEPVWQVALVQPNAPCIFEREDSTEPAVRRTLLEMTAGISVLSPDLVVWPETALIRSLPYESFAMDLASNGAVAARAPLLTGTVEYHPGRAPRYADRRFYNAAWLFSSNGVACGAYRKQHLVPFGEYIPGDRIIPALEKLSPVGFSCTAGRESTILRIPRRLRGDGLPADELAFSPLICFEDTVAPLARKAVRKGARLLVNLTNDAWFNGSIEPEQHMAHAVFRCVENGVPMVRAANTGVSGVITPVGFRQVLEGNGRTSGFAGVLPCLLAVPRQPLPTLYTRWGDWTLARPAALLFLAVLLMWPGRQWSFLRRRASGHASARGTGL